MAFSRLAPGNRRISWNSSKAKISRRFRFRASRSGRARPPSWRARRLRGEVPMSRERVGLPVTSAPTWGRSWPRRSLLLDDLDALVPERQLQRAHLLQAEELIHVD